MFTRREFIAASASALTGISDPAATIAQAARAFEGGTLRLLAPNGCQSNLAPVVAAWREQTAIPVEISYVDVDQIGQRVTADHLVGRVDYDLALPATFVVPDLAETKIIQPIDAILSALEMSAFVAPSLYEHGSVLDGQRYGFQTDGDVYLMFYRRDFLMDPTFKDAYAAQFGVALGIPRSWAELDRQMAFFHAPGKGRFGGALFRTPSYQLWEFWSRFHAAGLVPFDEDLMPQIDRPEAAEVVRQMARATAHLHPAVSQAGLFENWRLYKAHQIYCNIGWGGSQKAFNAAGSSIRGKLEHSLLPGDMNDPLGYFNWGWTYVVLSNARAAELATLFALFATSGHVSTLGVREMDGYFDPYAAHHYDDAGIIDTYSKLFLTVHRTAMTHAVPDLYLPGHSNYMSALSSGLSRAMSGASTPEQALRKTAREWRLISQDIGEQVQRRRWAANLALYPAEFKRRG